MKTIHIDIAPDGSIKIEAYGYTGKSCEVATAPFERVLLGDDKKRTKKREYGQQESSQQSRRTL